MANRRMIDTRFWDDAYVARLAPSEKLAFLYLLTSPLTNISGTYELPLRRAVFDTGLHEGDLCAALARFEADGKVVRRGDWIGVVNFVRHQSLNPSVRTGIRAGLARAPRDIVDALKLPPGAESLRVACDSLSIRSGSVLQLNPNQKDNLNPNVAEGGREGRAKFLSLCSRLDRRSGEA